MSDLTSATRLQEKKRPRVSKSRKKQIHPLLMQYSHSDRLEDFISMQLRVRFDPDPDGNCQFAAMADQLATLGIFRSPETLRDEIVRDLRAHPFTENGTPLSSFVDENDWDVYLDRMTQNGEYGDHITLQRAAEMFNVQFLVISPLGINASTVVSSSNTYSDTSPLLVLGHFAEGQGEHYVSLEGPVSSYVQSILENEAEMIFSACVDQSDQGEPLDNVQLPNPADNVQTDSSMALPQIENQQSGSQDNDMNRQIDMPVLPTELLSLIVQLTLESDMAMLGVFNRVSHLFKKLAEPFLPKIYLREALGKTLELDYDNDNSISMLKLYKSAGRASGVAIRLKELFCKNSKWMMAWLQLKHISHGQFKIKDIFWKKL